MAVPFIDYRKKITHPKMVRLIRELGDKWGLSEQDVIYRLIQDSLMKEFNLKPPQDEDLEG